MKRFGLIFVILALLAACGPAPTPAPTPDLNATMSAFSGTMVAGTLTAQPTKTLIPTETPLPTETATLVPTETATLDPALTPTLDPALPGVPTVAAFTGQFAPGGNLEGLPVALLRVENLSGVKEIIVTLNGTTRPREVPVYLSYKVTGSLNISFYTGSWQYMVEIPGKRFINGGFRQTNKDKTTMKVYLTKVVLLGP